MVGIRLWYLLIASFVRCWRTLLIGQLDPIPPLRVDCSIFLKNEIVSRYKDAPWSEEEFSFVACPFTSHLQARFQDDFKPKLTTIRDLPANLVLTKAY